MSDDELDSDNKRSKNKVSYCKFLKNKIMLQNRQKVRRIDNISIHLYSNKHTLYVLLRLFIISLEDYWLELSAVKHT